VPNSLGQLINDAGCMLFQLLEDSGETWTPLRRSNTANLHPLWFGVYGDLVYHHGAGFRERMENVDAPGRKTINPRVAARACRSPAWLSPVHRVERGLRFHAALRRQRKLKASGAFFDAAERLSDEVFQSILEKPDAFHEQFMTTSRAAGHA